jgi:hypothetical protein
VRRLLVSAIVVRSSLILEPLMMEAISSSETSVLTGATRRNIPEDTILPYIGLRRLPSARIIVNRWALDSLSY